MNLNNKNSLIIIFLKGRYNLSVRSVSFIFLLYIFFGTAKANSSSVKVFADTNQIRIGEQFHLNFSSGLSPGTKVIFPLLPDTFNNLEVVNRTTIDTISAGQNKELTLLQRFTLTGFDSGYFVIPPFPFVISDNKGKTDTVMSEALLLSVQTVAVDTTKDIRAIKGVIDVPFPWHEYLIYFLIAWILVAIILYVYNKFFKKKKAAVSLPKIPDRPAYEIAIEELQKIEEAKYWQQGLTKKYYIEVTDVIRQYIERRFSIFAMEQTTDEILSYFDRDISKEEEKEKLRFLLRLADMVKFAKVLPLASENETSLQYAYSFVNNTRPVVKEDFETAEELK